MSEKMCAVCLEILPLSAFYARPDAPDGRRRECKSCHLEGKRVKQLATRYRVGRIGLRSPGAIAGRVARLILKVSAPCAVEVHEDGAVWVNPDLEAGDGLVGVYGPELGVVSITSYVRDDLLAARDEMGSAA